jgi:hypothetical protein
MVFERKTRRSAEDKLVDKFTTSLTERRQRAEQVRHLVREFDMAPDLAREIVDARMRRKARKGGRK